jgi:hypothetical protein
MDKTATLTEAAAAEDTDTYAVILIQGSACGPTPPKPHRAPFYSCAPGSG